ncbi:MAG: acyl-CoA carboxylase subunit beta [Planctomycetota bacterium]|nr:MAG: acyl-CoA carboxylase subunit beta [Planctomycetota bacterium]
MAGRDRLRQRLDQGRRRRPMATLRELTDAIRSQEEVLLQGGGPSGQERQRKLGRLPVRERLALLLDEGTPFLETGLWAAHGMYPEFGAIPAAGIVTGIGWIAGRPCLVAANDATVKAGAMFPQSVKKLIRAQKTAYRLRLPIVYLVDSSGVFLPLQDEIFPDEDDFGRIFRNNAVLAAEGIPQIAAVMGNCIAGGAYLPVLCDKVLMTEGSQLCLAGPALVKAAIGQSVDPEELGGATMHATLSGTVDFHEPDDAACLGRIRELIDLLPGRGEPASGRAPAAPVEEVYRIVPADGRGEYEVRDLLACIIDSGSLAESSPDHGRTLLTAYARIGGRPAGIVANARRRVTSPHGEVQIGGVLYGDAARKAARFVTDCDRNRIPLIFIQDVQGFMVGREAEQSGIIRSGAELVRAMSIATVPKFTCIVGSSYGAGHYAMCGRAYDPSLILAWPNARYAVMGGGQAAETILSLKVRDAEKQGKPLSPRDIETLGEHVRETYREQTDIRYAAARGWVDAIIEPHQTRTWLAAALAAVPPTPRGAPPVTRREV